MKCSAILFTNMTLDRYLDYLLAQGIVLNLSLKAKVL